MPYPTRVLHPRDSLLLALQLSASSLESDRCKHKNSGLCEKPYNQNAMEIGLGIGIPAAVFILFLGILLYRNYLKDKKEQAEHDPDFDENGDATALPDFPAFKEDPFDNRYLVRDAGRYHYDYQRPESKLDVDRGLLVFPDRSFTSDRMDGFVLPYHHQTGLKALLDEFARHIDTVPSRSQFTGLARLLPQKPKGYTNLPNHSLALLPDTLRERYEEKYELYAGKDTLGETSDLDNFAVPDLDKFAVQYENELQLALLPVRLRSFNEKMAYPEPDLGREPEGVATDGGRGTHETHETQGMEVTQEKQDTEWGQKTHETHNELQNGSYADRETEHGHETEHGREPYGQSPQDAHTAYEPGQHELEARTLHKEPTEAAHYDRAPRISAFNLLQNVSEDEEEAPTMTPEQAEELARMKLVYKVYFDRTNSVKTNAEGAFQADATAPLPAIDLDRLHLNSELRGDTNYARRQTTALLVYDEPDTHEHTKRELPPLAPLKALPHASDIRNSTIETFTDYRPHVKQLPATKHSFDNDSMLSLPLPVEAPYKASVSAKPLPSQVARASVVMLDPVSEIHPSKAFKPAGLLPSAKPGYLHDELANSGDDLIPGNRKSAVRRMMNTKF